jgi:hypothetical protein
MAFDRAQLKDVLAGETGAVPLALPPVRPGWRGRLPMAAAAIIVASVGIALVLWSVRTPSDSAPRPNPAGSLDPVRPDEFVKPQDRYRGFAGMVEGKVGNRTEGGFSLSVTEVPGMPGHPMTGRIVHVAGGLTKSADGEVAPDRTHQNFIRKLDRDATVRVDLRHVKDDIFVIGELTPEQIEWANRREEKRKPAESRDDPGKKSPERPRKDAPRDAPREGAPREGPRDGDGEGDGDNF